MSAMDDMQSDMGGMKERYDELRQQAEDGSLDDAGREELDQLRDRFET